MAVTRKTSSKQASILNFEDIQKDQNTMQKEQNKLTRVVVHFDVGYNNHLFIRGNGANLSWNKGIMLRNTRSNEWVWETDAPFKSCEFKILINDIQYEQGNNHTLNSGKNMEYTPHF